MARTRSSTKSTAQPQRSGQPASAKTIRASKRKIDAVNGAVEVASKRAKPVRTPPRPRAEQRDCDICAESFEVTSKRFPKVSTCNHAQTVCSGCYITQIKTNLESNAAAGWTACTCPLCDQRIGQNQEARNLVSGRGVTALDKLIRDAKTRSAHNFLWCPAPNCGHGQVHPLTASPFVSCSKCKAKICFNHQRLWHEGLTCQEYDLTRELDNDARKNMEEIRRTTKPCPFCKMRIKKEGGCNHMSCSHCKKHWQWDSVPFDGETQGNSAEVAGGRSLVPALTGEELRNVNLVNQYENDGVAIVSQMVPTQVQLLPFAAMARERAQFLVGAIRHLINRVMPITPAPQRVPRTPRVRMGRTPGPPTRRSRRIHALSEGRLTVDLTRRDDPEDLGTEIIDLTHLD